MEAELDTRSSYKETYITFAQVLRKTCVNFSSTVTNLQQLKTFQVGLCFSRAAAMVINFNLLLVWLPMCKYTLTRVAYAANVSLQRLKQQQTISAQMGSPRLRLRSCLVSLAARAGKLARLAKMGALNCCLIAADNCTYLHTICATTITIASG